MQNKDPEKAFLKNEKKIIRRKKMKKWQIENSETSGISKIFFRVFQVLCLALNRHVFDQETPRIA